jgi:hypothetical protein
VFEWVWGLETIGRAYTFSICTSFCTGSGGIISFWGTATASFTVGLTSKLMTSATGWNTVFS